MKHVDALSRQPAVLLIETSLKERIKAVQSRDEKLVAISELAKTGPYNDYVLDNDVLYKQLNGVNLLVIPKSMELEVIRRVHEQGHFGVRKMEELTAREFYIPKLKQKLVNYVN
jgi:Integrase zinc binding domain